MSATTEELYMEWRAAYLCRGKAIDLAGEAQTHQEEAKILKTHEGPHLRVQIAVEDKVFSTPAETLEQLALKVLLAFTDANEPMDAHRESMIADAVRITGKPAIPNEVEADGTTEAYDPIPGWCEQYKLVFKEHQAACERVEGGKVGSPEVLEVESRLDPLEKLICNATPVTKEGAAAQIEFIKSNMDGGLDWDEHQPMLGRLSEALREMG